MQKKNRNLGAKANTLAENLGEQKAVYGSPITDESLISEEDEPVIGNITQNGKEIEIVPEGVLGAYRIQFKLGGQLPPEFNGLFTSRGIAQKHIDSYLRRKAS